MRVYAQQYRFGALAQLGERLHGMEEVESSILLRSTKSKQTTFQKVVFVLSIKDKFSNFKIYANIIDIFAELAYFNLSSLLVLLSQGSHGSNRQGSCPSSLGDILRPDKSFSSSRSRSSNRVLSFP
jgi:hypothetical protein